MRKDKKLKWRHYAETKNHVERWASGKMLIWKDPITEMPFRVCLRGSYITNRHTLDEAKKVAQIIHNG